MVMILPHAVVANVSVDKAQKVIGAIRDRLSFAVPFHIVKTHGKDTCSAIALVQDHESAPNPDAEFDVRVTQNKSNCRIVCNRNAELAEVCSQLPSDPSLQPFEPCFEIPRLALCFPWRLVLTSTQEAELQQILWAFKGSWKIVLTKDGNLAALLDPGFVNPIDHGWGVLINKLFQGVANMSPFLRVMPTETTGMDESFPWYKDLPEFTECVDVSTIETRRAVLGHMRACDFRSRSIWMYEKSWDAQMPWSNLSPDVMRSIAMMLPSPMDSVRRDLCIPCRHVREKWDEEVERRAADASASPWASSFGAPATSETVKYYRAPTTTLPISTFHSGIVAEHFSVVIAAADDVIVSVHFLA